MYSSGHKKNTPKKIEALIWWLCLHDRITSGVFEGVVRKQALEVHLFYFNLWGGHLPCRHGEAAFYLVSIAQYTGVSCATLAAPPCYL
jgi:hypothetical protein